MSGGPLGGVSLIRSMVNRKKAVARQLRNIKSQHGDWTAHNLRLLDDIFTISPMFLVGLPIVLGSILMLYLLYVLEAYFVRESLIWVV